MIFGQKSMILTKISVLAIYLDQGQINERVSKGGI